MRGVYSCNWQLTLAVEYFLEIHESLSEVNAPLVQKEKKRKKEKKKSLEAKLRSVRFPLGL